VDTSLNWKPGTGNNLGGLRTFDGSAKQDGFNVNVVSIELTKPLDEGQWSAGYHVQTLLGPDAITRGTRSFAGGTFFGASMGDIALHEAYVQLRAPVGNGLDFKIGQWATPIGYESFDGYKNPNFSRSYAFAVEPACHVGILAEYVLSDLLSFKAGIANSISTQIDARAGGGPASGLGETLKTYIGMVTLTAPESMGSLKGSSLSFGYINGVADPRAGFVAANTRRAEYFYVGGTLATPVAGLSLGFAIDRAEDIGVFDDPTVPVARGGANHLNAFALYASFAATEKLKLNLRGEYIEADAAFPTGFASSPPGSGRDIEIGALTLTADYALWQNVVTRAEVRWDKDLNHGGQFGLAADPDQNALTFALNVIYKF